MVIGSGSIFLIEDILAYRESDYIKDQVVFKIRIKYRKIAAGYDNSDYSVSQVEMLRINFDYFTLNACSTDELFSFFIKSILGKFPTMGVDQATEITKYIFQLLNDGKLEDFSYLDPATKSYAEDLATELPGVRTTVKYPCKCVDAYETLMRVIIHLNDNDKWSRERIADWVETLDVDTTFKRKSDNNATAGH